MKAWISPYALQSKGSLNSKTGPCAHAGCLIRVEFAENRVGYADCHPWPELGDSPLEFHLKMLKLGHLTRLMQQSLAIAKHDALCRHKKASLFENLRIPSSHALITDIKNVTEPLLDELKRQGFTRIKVKASKDNINHLKDMLARLAGSNIKLRLDFNSSLTRSEFQQVLYPIAPYLNCVEFFEDPIPFHLSIWKEIQKNYGVSLACDRDSVKAIGFPESAAYLIVKPAIQTPYLFMNAPQNIVITTYADHPLGQFAAAWSAANFKGPLGICGLLSHYAYETNPFSALIRHAGPDLHPPLGTGLGFDYLLQKLSWETLR